MTFIGYSTALKNDSKSVSSSPMHDWKQCLERMNRQLDFFGRLHEEICALMYWIDPSPEELLVRQRVIKERFSCVFVIV